MENNTADFKLTEAQISRLYDFAQKKFIHWYDLQIEIVDHLASSIEAEMQVIPGLSFESALEKVYKGFGIFGFAKIEQEKQTQLVKSAKRRWWNELTNSFKWPGIVNFILLFALILTLSVSLHDEMLTIIFLCIYIPITIGLFIYIMKDLRLQKRLLLMHSGATYFTAPFIFEFFLISTYTELTSLSFSILLTVGILIKLTSFRLYKKIRTEAERLYPAVFSK